MRAVSSRLFCLAGILACPALRPGARAGRGDGGGRGGAAPKRAPARPQQAGERGRERQGAARVNNWTIGVAGGGLLEGTFSKYAADLGKALDDGDNLRVLPINTFGAVGNVVDLVYLKGRRLCDRPTPTCSTTTRTSTASRHRAARQLRDPDVPGRVHLYVRPEIKTIEDLADKKASASIRMGSAVRTGHDICSSGGRKGEQVFMNNSLALEAMRRGELFGIVHVVGKPNSLFVQAEQGRPASLLRVEYTGEIPGLLHPGGADACGLSQSDPARPDRSDDLGAGSTLGLQLGAQH